MKLASVLIGTLLTLNVSAASLGQLVLEAPSMMGSICSDPQAKEIARALRVAIKEASLVCVLEAATGKAPTSEVALTQINNILNDCKTVLSVREGEQPVLIANTSWSSTEETEIRITTSADMRRVEVLDVEKFNIETTEINVGTILQPRFERVQTRKFIVGAKCQPKL